MDYKRKNALECEASLPHRLSTFNASFDLLNKELAIKPAPPPHPPTPIKGPAALWRCDKDPDDIKIWEKPLPDMEYLTLLPRSICKATGF